MQHQTVTTAKSSDLPMTLAEAKQHLRQYGSENDEEIQAQLEAALEVCETDAGRSLRVSHTLTQTYPSWPCNPVRFDRQPVKSITSVTYYDADGASQTLASSNYRLHKSTLAAAYLEFDDSFTQPTTDYRDDAVTITYVAGYDALTDVPKMVKSLVKLKLSELYGDLDERTYANTVRSYGDLLHRIEWGCYR